MLVAYQRDNISFMKECKNNQAKRSVFNIYNTRKQKIATVKRLENA